MSTIEYRMDPPSGDYRLGSPARDAAVRISVERDGERIDLRGGRAIVFPHGRETEALDVHVPASVVEFGPITTDRGLHGLVVKSVAPGFGPAFSVFLADDDLGLREVPAEVRDGDAHFAHDGVDHRAEVHLVTDLVRVVVPEEVADHLISLFGTPDTAGDTRYPFPFIAGKADPSIVPWDGGWLFIATDERWWNDPDALGLFIRRAGRIADLPDAAEHRILQPGGRYLGCFWAPELHVLDGRLWCYFAPSIDTSEWTGVTSCVMALKKDGDPTVPEDWEDPVPVLTAAGGPLQRDDDHPGISLDMTTFACRGVRYAVWSQRYLAPEQNGDAELWIATFDPADPTRLTSDPVRLLAPELSWELDNASVVEGPFAVVDDTWVVLAYAAGAVSATYSTGRLRAPAGADLLDPTVWSRWVAPIIDSTEGEWGPGHNSFTVDEDGELLFVYHAKQSKDPGYRDSGVRRVRLTEYGTLAPAAR